MFNKFKQFLAVLATVSLLSACGEHAAQQSGQGAAMGAASGAVGGMISALIFGGDPVEAAARGAVYAGAAGATAGAISGSQVDAGIRERRLAKENQIREKIGSDAFSGLSALVSCDYDDTLNYATSAQASNNPNFAVAGYWLEVLSYADQNNSQQVNQLIPTVIEKDWDTEHEEQARKNIHQLRGELEALRLEYKLPATCAD